MIARLCDRHRANLCKDRFQKAQKPRDGERYGRARCAALNPAVLVILAARPACIGMVRA